MVQGYFSIGRLLFPPRCLLCGGRGDGVCPGCLGEFPFIEGACRRCALPLEAGEVCGRCLKHPPAFHSAFAPFHYAFPVRELILALKFHRQLHLAPVLGRLMAEALATRDLPERLLPVPLHPKRLRERGYNQALELARPIARTLGIPLETRACLRVRPTPAQAGLPARRRRVNVAGAFRLARPLQARHVAVVDDVVTTGSTVQALALELIRGGAERVEVWSLSRASMAS